MFKFCVDRDFMFLNYDVNLALIILQEGGKNGEAANCVGELIGRNGHGRFAPESAETIPASFCMSQNALHYVITSHH